MAGEDKAVDRQEGRRRGARPQPHQLSRPPAGPALRRPAPARGDRPRHRARAQGLPVRRAAVQPRRGTARHHAAGDQRAAPAAQDDHGLRHPRPGRGDDDGRQDRRAERRQHRAGRLAAGALPQPAQPVRRRVHRLAEDEPDRGRPGREVRRPYDRRPAGAPRVSRPRRASGRARWALPSISAPTPSCTSTPTVWAPSMCAPTARSPINHGDTVYLSPDPTKLHRFSPDGKAM